MSDIDRAAGNVLRAKFAARLFDGAKYRDPALVRKFVQNPQHRQLARPLRKKAASSEERGPPLQHTPSNCSDGAFYTGMDWGGDNNQSYTKVRNVEECCEACVRTSVQPFLPHFSSMDCYLKGGNRTS